MKQLQIMQEIAELQGEVNRLYRLLETEQDESSRYKIQDEIFELTPKIAALEEEL